MKRPYDLVAFLEQERRVELLETLRDDMTLKDMDYMAHLEHTVK